ncbi:MAG: FHA domain-containing protein [Chloroflexi bacterium]|nr:FHA domain-containing protein [Chloroflexota bacterium]
MDNLEEFPLLVAQTGPLAGKRWALGQPIVIGREAHCDIIVDDRQVSRYHARLTPSTEGIILEDLGSKNGTLHNGNAIVNPVVLTDGDVLQISLVQSFIFFASDATMPLAEQNERSGKLRLDTRSRRVWVNNQLLVPSLSAMQFHILQILYDHQGQVVSRQELVSSAWGDEQAIGVTDQALDALVRRLRERLAALDPHHAFIATVRGHGVRLDNPRVE